MDQQRLVGVVGAGLAEVLIVVLEDLVLGQAKASVNLKVVLIKCRELRLNEFLAVVNCQSVLPADEEHKDGCIRA